MRGDDVLADQSKHLFLQTRNHAGQFGNLAVRQFAHCRGVQGHGVALVSLGINGVQTDQVAGQMETEHLFAARFIDEIGFQISGADGVKRVEAVADTKQVVAFVQRSFGHKNRFQALDVGTIQAHRQAEFGKRTGTANLAQLAMQVHRGAILSHVFAPCMAQLREDCGEIVAF